MTLVYPIALMGPSPTFAFPSVIGCELELKRV
jgi:hypothetical protein